jgi:hypothetical protein
MQAAEVNTQLARRNSAPVPEQHKAEVAAVAMHVLNRYILLALQATIKAIQRKTGLAELSLKDVPMDSFQVSCQALFTLQMISLGIIRLNMHLLIYEKLSVPLCGLHSVAASSGKQMLQQAGGTAVTSSCRGLLCVCVHLRLGWLKVKA